MSKEGNIICIIKICEMNIAQRETDCGGNTFHDPIDCMIARTQPYLTPEVEVKLADRVEPILTLDVEPLCSPLLDGVDTAGYQFLVVPSKGPAVHRVKGRLQVDEGDLQWLTEFAVHLR